MGREDDIAQRDEPDVVPPSTTETSATESAAAGDDLYRAVFNLNSAIKLLIDASTGAIIDANDAAVEFYGWSREELAGMRISDINTLTPDEVEAELANANSGARRHFRFRHRTAKGDIRHVEVHSGPVPLNGRNVLLSIIHDVTDRDALEWQLRQAQRLEMVGQLAGTVAHEFNNLLTVMVGALSSLERRLAQTQVEGSTRVPLRDLSFAIERAEQLTHGLLAFSRRQTSEPRELDVNQVTQSLIELLRRSIKPRLHIRLELASALPPIQGDPHQIEAILMNLVLNARDAVEEGGTIRVTTELASAESASLPPERFVVLRVADDGGGMDDATKQRIFEPFFTTKPAGQGTGLGLATVQGLVRKSGGKITVETAPGEGSVFTVFLPVEPPEPESDPELEASTRVLLVEDNDPLRRALKMGLESFGFAVVAVASAEEALAVASDDYDVVVSDICLPERSGVDLLLELRQAKPRAPVVLVTGGAEGPELERVPKGTVILRKPLLPGTIAKAIEALEEP